MFVNAVIARKLRKVGDKPYKVAHQALYPAWERNEAIYELENCRVYKIRVQLTTKDRTYSGYIRHVARDGEKFSMLFPYRNSTKGITLQFPIEKIEQSRGKRLIYNREKR